MFFLDTIHSPERREWLVGIVYFGFDYYNYYCGCGYTMKTYHHTINLTAGGSLREFYSNFKTIVSNIKWQCLKSEKFKKTEFSKENEKNIQNKNHQVIPVVFFCWWWYFRMDGYISFNIFDLSSDKIIQNL